ncbi:MAG: 7TM diverse intracellular signaling domain-containing protein [Cytophagaceae bacterium]
MKDPKDNHSYLFKRTTFFCLLILFCISLNASAQKVILLDDATKEFIFHGEYFEILEDQGGRLNIHEVSDSLQNRFVLNKRDYVYNENIHSVYWLKFKVKNNARSGKNFLLESYSPHTNDLQFFIPHNKGFKVKRTGIDHDFYNREYINKNIVMDLPVDTARVQTFYLRVHSMNFSSFDFRIKPVHYFAFYSVNEYYFLGIYYGILIIMAVYNLLMFFSVRERVYIYYVIYILSGILTTLADDSLGYQYVWFKFPHVNPYIGAHIAPTLLLFTFMIYSREFLQLKNLFPLYNRLMIGVTVFYFVYYTLSLTFFSSDLYFRGVYVLPFITVYFVALGCFFKGYKPARFFIIGYTFIFVGVIIIRLRSNGSIEGNLFTVYSLNYGLVLEAIVMSFALADRFKLEKMEKENALKERALAQGKVIDQLVINQKLKDKVNQELEAKVTERTRELHEKNAELEEANNKLKEVTDKAHQMSLRLDVDNWDLQKKIHESIRVRMSGQEVSLQEFSKIFPDESACCRFLSELKWGESFGCRKCGGSEAQDEGFSKKCSKCGYVESVTANTLFHAVKFPLHKAFYIAYKTVHEKEKMTLDELSALLDLRRNTCWTFRNKVYSAAEVYKKVSHATQVHSWEKIILPDKS